MKKTLFLSGITAMIVGSTMLCGAEPCPQGPKEMPPCTAMQQRPGAGPQFRKFEQKDCPMMRKKDAANRFGMDRRIPMNEDEMAQFRELRMDVMDALGDYRAEPTDKNKEQLRAAVEKMVNARQQFEITRCEKALARAKAATAKKDKIVEREVKRLSAAPRDCPKPGPKAPRPGK